MDVYQLQEGDRVKVFENVIFDDSRELTGDVLFIDVMSDVFFMTIDSSLKLSPEDTGKRCVPGSGGWEKI